MPVLPRPQPTTSPGRRPRLDRSSERALGAPPAAGAAPTLLQLSTADMVVEALRPRAGTPRTSDAAARSVTTQGSLRKALADGHCLFETWQMGRSVLGLSSCSKFECRKTTAGWMLQNAAKIINGMTLRFWVRVECEDGHISEAAKHETYEEYCRKMGSSTRFGGLPEILAFTEQDGLNAWVWTPARGRRGWYERVTKVDVVQGAKRIHLCRNRAGDHYDLLVPYGPVFDEDDVAAAFNGVSAHTHHATASTQPHCQHESHPTSASVQA